MITTIYNFSRLSYYSFYKRLIEEPIACNLFIKKRGICQLDNPIGLSIKCTQLSYRFRVEIYTIKAKYLITIPGRTLQKSGVKVPPAYYPEHIFVCIPPFRKGG